MKVHSLELLFWTAINYPINRHNINNNNNNNNDNNNNLNCNGESVKSQETREPHQAKDKPNWKKESQYTNQNKQLELWYIEYM